MSFNKAVKWFAIYVLLTLGFAAVTALTTFVFVAVVPYRYEFSSLFFSFLFLAGIVLVLLGVLIVIQAPARARDYKSVEINAEKIEQLIINIEKKFPLRREQIEHVLFGFLGLLGLSFVFSWIIYWSIMENETTRESFSMPTEPEDVLRGYVIFFAVVLCIVVLGAATLLLGDYIKHRMRARESEIKPCPQCGRTLPPNVKFCPYCGKTLGE